MHGYMVYTLIKGIKIRRPIKSVWFCEWIAAIREVQFQKDKIGSDCYHEVIYLNTGEIVLCGLET